MNISIRASVVSIFSMLALLTLPTLASADTVGPITFDSPTYTLGSVNGQQGWSGSGIPINPSIDQEVVSNATSSYSYSGLGDQSFRISDAFTDGAFGDWIFSPSLINEAGESTAVSGGFSGGTRQKHFEAQFDLASALPALTQTGMHLSVSPDRGDGARMSYLRFEDHIDGIHVFFDDVTDKGPVGTVATFNETDIATLSKTAPHTVKFSIDFVDGPGNDVVKIYIDGALQHIGTTWEDYYRFDPEQAGSSNAIPTVDSLIFQTRTSSGPILNPNDSGHGFLVDNLSLESGATPTITTNVVIVTPNDLETNLANAAVSGKWYFYNDTDDTLNNTLGTFVTGPATPPRGTGSAQATLADATGRVLLTNSSFGGTHLSAINMLGFSEYSHSGSGISATEVPFVRFNVDFTGTNVFQGSLVYEPNDNGTVTQDGWQTWDMVNGGNAKWEYTNHIWPTAATGPDAGVVGQSGNTARTWNAILADYPSIQMLASGPQIGMRVGEPGPSGYAANLDAVTIGIGNTATTYDFEPAPAAPSTFTVSILKYIGNDHATVTNASNATFPFIATYQASNLLGGNAGSDPFTIGPTGNGTPNSYEAKTVDLATGASYSAAENVTGNDVVGASCTDSKPFALTGYSSGDTFEQAFANASSSTAAPMFTNLTNNKVVIVWNKICPVAPPPAAPQVHIFKFVDGVMATAANANSAIFPMNASWVSSTLGTVPSAGFTLSPAGWGASDAPYEASYVGGALGDNYATNEVLTTPVVGAECDGSHTYSLQGYTSGNTIDEAMAGTPNTASPSFTDLQSDKYVIVWNKTCPTTASLTITKSSIGGNGTFSFTSDIPGHTSFQIVTSNNQGVITFDGIAPGTYHVAEVNQPKGWTQTDTSCDEVPLSAGQTQNCVVTDTSNKMLGSIRGSKFEDWDGDGSPFETRWEVGLKGWTITISGPNGFSSSTVTNKQGLYIFSGLSAGTYTVREVQQQGWMSTYPSSNPALDQWVVNLAAGQNAKKKDFGNFKLGTISGMKYEDKNGNHRKDNAEGGLQGWTIQLKKAGGGTVSTVTDVNGNYSFVNLAPGLYTLSEVMQSGWKQTDKPNPVKVRSGMTASHEYFGNKRIVTGSHGHEDDSDND